MSATASAQGQRGERLGDGPNAHAATIPATDGYELAASTFGPPDADHVVVVGPASGIARRFYDAYAEFLAGHDLAVVTFDYRGIADSGPDDLRGFEASMREWGTKDLTGAIRWVRKAYAPERVSLVGHSAGAQLLGVAENNSTVDDLLVLAGGSGYWGHWPRPSRYKYAAFWFGLLPAVTRATGYFPARKLAGWHSDMPRGVALEWARWCRHPDYLRRPGRDAPDDHFDGFDGRIRAYSFSDDVYAPEAAVDWLVDQYVHAPTERLHLTPADAGVERVGHFGFFKLGDANGLWHETAEWLTE